MMEVFGNIEKHMKSKKNINSYTRLLTLMSSSKIRDYIVMNITLYMFIIPTLSSFINPLDFDVVPAEEKNRSHIWYTGGMFSTGLFNL